MGKEHSIMRLPNGEILRLRSHTETGKLLIKLCRRTACGGGIALQPIDAFAPKHSDDLELQSDNGCETTIVPVEQRNSFTSHRTSPATASGAPWRG